MTTTTPVVRTFPELEAPKLYRRVIMARLQTERADDDAATERTAQAYAEAETARTRLAVLEAEYRTMRVEHVA